MAGWKIDDTQSIIDTDLPRSGGVARGGMENWEGTASRVIAMNRRSN